MRERASATTGGNLMTKTLAFAALALLVTPALADPPAAMPGLSIPAASAPAVAIPSPPKQTVIVGPTGKTLVVTPAVLADLDRAEATMINHSTPHTYEGSPPDRAAAAGRWMRRPGRASTPTPTATTW